MSQADPAPAAAPPPGMPHSLAYRGWFLFVMVLVSASVVGERYMMVVLVEPIRRELHLSDTALAVAKDLVIAIVYIVAVIPLARLADRWSKRRIVAIAAGVWSAAVLLCGSARGFAMLVVGRAGIGLGEGGFTPASQAWIADMFPIRQRATALSIFLLGASLGNLAGPALGGVLAAEYGWRGALLLASLPGLVLAPIVWFTLRDVPPGFADGAPPAGVRPRFVETARALWAIRTFPPLVLSAGLNALLTMGLISWAPAFMERSHGMPARDAGLQMGGALFVGSVIGHSLGGPLADLLGRRDLRWYVWLLMASGGLAAASGYILLSGPAAAVFPLFGLNLLIGGLSAAPLMAVVTGLAPLHARATAVAVLMVVINVVGLGGGPVAVGWLSDMLRPLYGEDSLRHAMRWILFAAVPATLLAWAAARTVRADIAAAGGWGGAPAGVAGH